MNVTYPNRKTIFLRNVAFICLIGNMLYHLFPFPPIVWRVSFLITCLYCIFMCRRDIPFLPFEKAIFFFAGLNLVYFFWSYMWQEPKTTQIGNSLCSLLSFSLFYYLKRKKVLSEKFINVIAIILTLSAILAYFQAERVLFTSIGMGDEIDLTNNASTNFLYLLPLLFLLKKQWIRFIVLITSLFFILHSAKRGNIVAAIPVTLLLLPSFWNTGKGFLRNAILVSLLSVAAYYLYQFSSNYEYLQYRIEKTREGSTSHRDIIYNSAWHLWLDADSYHRILFGYGTDGTIYNTIMEKRAHNDWLEVLVDYGLLGLFSYFIVFILLFQLAWMYRKEKELSLAILSCSLIWFLKTLYSMGYTDESLTILMLSLGYAIAKIHNKKEEVSLDETYLINN